MDARSLIFEKSRPGRGGNYLPECALTRAGAQSLLPGVSLRRTPVGLAELSEVDVVRHYTGLSRLNFGVDNGFYPLGSCTMKYNPKINDALAALEGFCGAHPLQPEEGVQGCLEVCWRVERMLADITGMDAVTLQPAAGAHGELTGLLMVRAYHESRGDLARTRVLVPDSAHGTNPASAALAGFDVVEIPSGPDGGVDLDALRAAADETTAALMLTNPSTLGLFEQGIEEIADIVHGAGGLLYYDGANLNAVMGIVRPGDMGFDVVHVNLHKTFSTPHGGGGPGSGPVGVKSFLEPFLPIPRVRRDGDVYTLDEELPQSIGRVRSFYGNFGVVLRSFAYILVLGADGVRESARTAVLNANYLMARLRDAYDPPYDRACMHEFVLSAQSMKASHGVSAMDVAKALLDYGYHPPTVYFPLIVHEAIMIEPTETEAPETLDAFADAMLDIARRAGDDAAALHAAPEKTVVGRPDETSAARKPILRYTE